MAKWPIHSAFKGPIIESGAGYIRGFGVWVDTEKAPGDEARTQQEVRDTLTASNLRIYVTALVGSTHTLTFRVNGGNGNQTFTMSGTGEFEDSSNTDSLVSGDLINVQPTSTASMHGDDVSASLAQCTLGGSSDVPQLFANGQGNNHQWQVRTTEYASLLGSSIDHTSEALAEYTMRANRTLRDLRVYAHSYSSNTPTRIRVNRANGNLVVTVSGTGEFLDTSNTDSFVAGDEANYQAVGGDVDLTARSVEANTSSGIVMAGAVSVGAAANYFHPAGYGVTTTEAQVETEAEAAATLQNLFVNAGTIGETRTIQIKVNQSAGNQSVSVNASNALFEDTSNTDSLVAEDDFAFLQAAGSSGTNDYPVVAVEWETDVGGAPADQEVLHRAKLTESLLLRQLVTV